MRAVYSLNSLNRWSCKSGNPPDAGGIKGIHVYDFDNTLFSSPLPNPQVWQSQAIGMLQAYETLAYGGWWHDSSILAATGQGLEKEEPRAWEGCWNETVVQLVELSMQSKEVVTVLLTGRGETNFADLVNRICNAKKLNFDLVVLKPEVGPTGQKFESTMSFKQEFLKELTFTYKHADEIRIYEDRPKHVKGFRDFFERVNKSLISHPADQPPPPRKPITAEVIHVCELKATLNPEIEVEVVQRAINRHNLSVSTGGPNPTRSINKRMKIVDHFLYFGYLISQTDSARLISLVNTTPHLIDSGEVRLLASSILIAPYFPKRDLLQKVGGRGKKVTWQVTGFAKYEDRIWAARVSPVTETQISTQDPTPLVVLAIRKGSRQVDAAKITKWEPVAPEKAFMFETTVGDKVLLKIEPDDMFRGNNGRGRSNFDRSLTESTHKRKFDDQDYRGKENYTGVAAAGAERDNRGWVPKEQGGANGRFNMRHTSKNQFNNKNNQAGGGARNVHQSVQGNTTRSRGNGAGQGGNRGGGRGGHAPPRGPPGYKSLDDYGPGNFDGATDSRSGGANAEMVMNY
ncbi:uncharacterized protein A1O9_00659 [Exophiala aquamarina CBS 119918]|uniref:Swiss Army Knife RNA repair protein HAD domain-containing protein n=1 Tax=Exophiala aquamarina CBS 119918 TaxID=1182545 RepID=A0A072PS45_9EURO|nr:uncharacterized protein A1O9_00659 [Exophiala aquamarina CBS 119918]KEF62686.1 hypothetical protein A1O9_00659 [Exophiala aquamarina CBS 119918]